MPNIFLKSLSGFQSSWNQQVAKRKKKKNQDTLQGGPYYLKDGDTIGIKNLLFDDNDDFSTIRDDIGKENQKRLALEKKKSDTFCLPQPRSPPCTEQRFVLQCRGAR